MTSSSTMALPAALRPWRDWLHGFDVAQIEALGAMLLPLQAAIGSFRAPPRKGHDEPNGYDDLQRRGPYDRLLLSEWMLADELPDEFLRRASANEHLFLAPRRESVRVDRRIVAIFDDGALQLGASRLAQLALWILLARRATDAGAAFAWATLHMSAFAPQESAADALKRLLQARCLQRSDAQHLQRWTQRPSDGPETAECWLIGAPQIDRSPQTLGLTHRVLIERDLAAHLTVDIAGPSSTRHARVPIPANHAAQSLLRGNFNQRRAMAPTLAPGTTTRFDPRIRPVFGRRGKTIMLVTNDHRALIYRRPKRKGAPRKPEAHVLNSSGSLLGVAANGNLLGTIHVESVGMHGAALGRLKFCPFDGTFKVEPPSSTAALQPCLFFDSKSRHQTFFIDAAGTLFEWRDSPVIAMGELKRVADRTLAISRGNDAQLVYACVSQGRVLLRSRTRLDNDASPNVQDLDGAPADEDTLRVVINGWDDGAWRGFWAIPRMRRRDDGTLQRCWELRKVLQSWAPVSRTNLIVDIGDGEEVLGIVQPTPLVPALVARSTDGRTLLLVSGEVRQTLYTSAQPFSAVSVASDCNLIAVVTFDQRLVVLEPGGRDAIEWPAPLQGRMS